MWVAARRWSYRIVLITDWTHIILYGHVKWNLYNVGASSAQTVPPARAGTPCVCQGQFFQSCPESCLDEQPIVGRSVILHDLEHPDHIDGEIGQNKARLIGDRRRVAQNYPRRIGKDLKPEEALKEAPVVRHRKVYVKEYQNDKLPVLKPFTITIPVKLNPPPAPNIPKPRHMYRLHKYTTYETKPEVQMIPVTTTVIKPAGLGRDQLIDDKESQSVEYV